MKFEGDLSKFFPPDLLIFLANLGKEGVLTVTHNKEFLSISFKNGSITDAHSNASDEKLLKIFYLHKHINRDQYRQIAQAKRETGMDVLQIIEKMDLLSFNDINDIIIDRVKEVLFKFFLLKQGEFIFSNIHVDAIKFNALLTPQAIAIEIASWIDDWHEIERKLTTFDRQVIPSCQGRQDDISDSEKILFKMIQSGKTIRTLINQAPLLSYKALGVIDTAISQKRLILQQSEEKASISNSPNNQGDELFYNYKAAYKKIISTQKNSEKIKGIIGFCKDHFDQIFVISTTKETLVRGFVFFKDKHQHQKSSSVANIQYNIDDDPVFSRAYSSGYSFFGKVFPAKIINHIMKLPVTGECAVIPLGKRGDRMNLIYAVSATTVSKISQFHYIELLSWLINPEIKHPRTANALGQLSIQNQPTGHRPSNDAMVPRDKTANVLAEIIDDLPPMPHLSSKMLQILSEPDSSVNDLTTVLVKDQSMMATLMKVSNSVLYRTGGEISTLDNAVTRLGFKTVRSLILTATTHSLFPKDNAKLEAMSQILWQHSKECGLASQRVAEIVGFHAPEEAFVAGLLHDIGKLSILLKLTSDYTNIVKQQKSGGTPSIEAEKNVLGFDHTEVGGRLMDKWKIPGNIAACVKFHHAPQKADQFEKLAYIVALGDCLSHLHGMNSSGESHHSRRFDEAINALGLSTDDIDRLNELIIDNFKHSDIFD